MSKRDAVVEYGLWGVDNEPQIHYSQDPNLRFAALDEPKQLPISTDCSAFYTLACKYAGVYDPNGSNYNGTGFTGTLLGNMEEIPLDQALPGDAIVYGPGSGDHVCMVISMDNPQDPLLVSHGQERGPIKIRHSAEVASHRAPVRVLRLAVGVEEEELVMEQAVEERFAALELRVTELHNHLLGGEGVRGVEATVNHIEQMLSSDITVDNNTLKEVVGALGQIKDDISAMRNAQVGPPANGTPST